MWKIFKWIGIVVGVILLTLVIAGFIAHKPRPNGTTGPEADALAQKMLAAVDQSAWDSTRYIGWTFMDMHHYQWDRQQNLVEVQWGTNRVLLHTPTQNGLAWNDGQQLSGPEAEKAIELAWGFFCNDSFWLQAFNKVFDPGTERALVPQEDGTNGLLVTYTSGGVTPGDSYLWLLDENGRPRAWKMWVSALPIGGLTFTWENWSQLPTGAWVASDHKNKLANVVTSNIRGGHLRTQMSGDVDPFAEAAKITATD